MLDGVRVEEARPLTHIARPSNCSCRYTGRIQPGRCHVMPSSERGGDVREKFIRGKARERDSTVSSMGVPGSNLTKSFKRWRGSENKKVPVALQYVDVLDV